MAERILLTGATGLVGGDVLLRLLRGDRAARATVLVRDMASWPALAARLGPLATRVMPLHADIAVAGLGLDALSLRRLAESTTLVVHCAADTRFSQSLSHARRQNRDGTCNVLALAGECDRLRRFVHVSTAFVAGRMTGFVDERPLSGNAGWVNAYEQSKHEAERAVHGSGLPWVIARPSTIVCDGVDGSVRQVNAVHRALALCRAGLAAMVPGEEHSTVDLVTADYVSGGVARLATAEALAGRTFHLCAGAGALPLGELLDRSYAFWQRDGRWRRRGVARPALTSLETYRLFETAVAETGDMRLQAITRSLTHFVPQLALPKRFGTMAADALLGYRAPAVREFWEPMLAGLAQARRGSRSAA